MKVGVVGKGYVGKATISRLGGQEIYILDPPKNYNDDLSDCELIFICINDTEFKMPSLNKLVKSLCLINQTCTFIIRTTIPAGTTDSLIKKYNREFVFMPEFLREWNAEYDALHPDKTIFGTHKIEIFETLKKVFNTPNALLTKPIEAELAKLALNSLALIKVVFAEELFDLAIELKAEYENIYKIFKLDQNINERHLIPNKDGYRGAGGKCLPKDGEFLSLTGKKFKSEMTLIDTVIKQNKKLLGE